MGEADETGDRLGIEDIAGGWRCGVGTFAISIGAADGATTGDVPHTHGLPSSGGHIDAKDGVFVRCQRLKRAGVYSPVRIEPSQNCADMAVEKSAARVRPPEPLVRPLYVELEQLDGPGGKLRILRHNRSVCRSRRIRSLIVKDDLHVEGGCFFDNPPHETEKLVGEIADAAGQADARMGEHAAKPGGMKSAKLADELLLLEVVVPEPERNEPELSRGIDESLEARLETHQITMVSSSQWACSGSSFDDSAYDVYARGRCRAELALKYRSSLRGATPPTHAVDGNGRCVRGQRGHGGLYCGMRRELEQK